MISGFLRASFTDDALKSIDLHSTKFTWKQSVEDGGNEHLDGPTMLKLILTKVNPSTMIGTDNYRKIIQNTRLPQHGYDVTAAMESIEAAFKEIIRRNETYDSKRLHVFDALKSGKNSKFKAWVERVEQDVCSGTGEYKNYSVDQIMQAACKLHTDMVSAGEWDRLDPEQAQIIALTTALEQARKSGNIGQPPPIHHRDDGTGGGGGGRGGGKSSVEEWRLTKTKGDSCVHDGRTYWWCPKHNNNKGMYVRHPPEDHDKQAAASKSKRNGGSYNYVIPDPLKQKSPPPSANATTDTPNSNSGPSTLELGKELNQVLATYGLSDTDASSAWAQAVARASKK